MYFFKVEIFNLQPLIDKIGVLDFSIFL